MSQIVTNVGSPGAISGAGGGRTYAYNNLTTTPQQIVGANAFRQRITVHNPGTVDALVAPTSVQNTGSDVVLTPGPSSRGGCFLVYANGGTLVIDGECQKSYQALSVSGSGNPLTVVDSNV